ncbi:MAG: 2,3-bisphosphoglycerate-independent phosphoglycerate mutase [Candidatus Hydrothermarchaeales archaeon]
MKTLIVVCDGMADRPIRGLGGKTPLELAKTPNMDNFAKGGICGILDPIAPGIRAGSDTSHLAILGYDPIKVYTGRGPFEAAGVGLEILPGDIAFRCNFATVNKDNIVTDRRAGRITEGTKDLAKTINSIPIEGVSYLFKESTQHRVALVLKGEGLSFKVSDSDPHFAGKKVETIRPLDDSPEAAKTARILNKFIEDANKLLKNHEVNVKRVEEDKPPANALLLRGAGIVPKLEKFKDKHGLSGACIATVGLVKGIGSLCGLEVLDVPVDIKIKDSCQKALNEINNYDFLLLNLKDADNAAHDHAIQRKVSVIEEIDEALDIFSGFIEENYLVVLSDHTTSTEYGDHTGDSVPIMICGPEVRTDDVEDFGERTVAKGGLNRIRGQDIMNIMLNLTYQIEKFGA